MNLVYQQVVQETLDQLETLLTHNLRQQVSTDTTTDTQPQTHNYSQITTPPLSVERAGVSAVWTNQRALQRTAHPLLLSAAYQHVPRSLPQTVLQGQTDRTGERDRQKDRLTVDS